MTETDIAPRRGPGRPPLRPMTEKQEGVREPARRRRLHSLNDDKFHIPAHLIPEGMSLEWKQYTVTGQEQPFHIQAMQMQGWEPCQFEDFPELAPGGMSGRFIKEGLMLMKRPMELTEEFHEEIREANRGVISNRMKMLGQTPPGQLPRDHPSAQKVSHVKMTYAPPVAIED